MEDMIDAQDLDYYDLINKGDDGLSDVLNHIIGMGKERYYECKNDIYQISSHALGGYGSKDGYSESFSYSKHEIYDILDDM